MIIVSDSTPLISLLKLNQLTLLQKYFGEVYIPEAVFTELTSNPRFSDEAKQIKQCPFIKNIKVDDVNSVKILRQLTGLDLGESEAIILSNTCHADLLLMDETKGRRVAEKLGLKIMGTIGLLLASYQNGHISAAEIKQSIELLRSSGRHISEKYLQILLKHIKD